MRAWSFLALSLLYGDACLASPPTVDFARLAEFSDVQLSPGGDYLAVSVVNEESRDLSVIRLSDMKVTLGATPGRKEHVYNIRWVSDKRILVSLASSHSAAAQPYPTGELMAIDRDGKNGRYLFGARGSRVGTDHNPDSTRHNRFAELVSPFIADPRYALIQSTGFFTPEGARYALAERMDVYNGRSHWATKAPVSGPAKFVTDLAGRIRYARGPGDLPATFRSFVRNPETDTWTEIQSEDEQADFDPLTISDDLKTGYLRVREFNDRYCLYSQDIDSGLRQRLACDDVADLSGIITSPATGRVLGAVFDPGIPKIHWFDTEDPDALLMRRIVAGFPGADVRVTSRSRDGKRFVVRVASDTAPGRFYLYDRSTDKLRYLLSRRRWIEPDAMPTRRAFQWKSRDGTSLYGYLTVPRSVSYGAGPLPTVVLLHGGPFDVRDTWEWTPEAAFLASHGYLVFQPQFRGSAGFGRNYRDAARRKLGTLMIDDITGGVEALIEKRWADPGRIAVVGHSFGGYAALMSAVRSPALYRCAVGMSGIYDLGLQYRTVRAQGSKTEIEFLRAFMGSDSKLLDSQSPYQQAERIRVPVLLTHGKADKAVDIRQSKRMWSALKHLERAVEFDAQSGEGHIYFDVDHRVALFDTTLEFLDRHMGVPATKQPAIEKEQ